MTQQNLIFTKLIKHDNIYKLFMDLCCVSFVSRDRDIDLYFCYIALNHSSVMTLLFNYLGFV